MASRWTSAGFVVALLAGAARGSSAQSAVPPVQQAVPGTPAPQRPAVAPGQQPADDASKRLGRKYPMAMPAPVPREPPEVHVSVVSPRDSGVHQHGARQRMQRAARTGGDLGGDVPAGAPPLR